MDPALLKQKEAFKKRAIATPVVESRKKDSSSSESSTKKKPKAHSSVPKDAFAYKTMSGKSQYNFSVLAKIVKYMKQRHLDHDTHPLSLEEILDETNQLNVGCRQRHWLVTEALSNNPKIQVTQEGKYLFKPAYNIKDRKSLLRLLDKHDQRGLGGILLEDVQESLPNTDKALKILGDSVNTVLRPVDKKKVLFYNDKTLQYTVDEEFQKLWRSAAVDGIDEQKIEEYLQKQGIASMQDLGVKKVRVTPVFCAHCTEHVETLLVPSVICSHGNCFHQVCTQQLHLIESILQNWLKTQIFWKVFLTNSEAEETYFQET